MKQTLIPFLGCPVCKGDLKCEVALQVHDLPWPEIMEGTLTCSHCHKIYPISAGIPRLVPDAPLAVEVQKTVDGFGYEWQTFNDQIQDGYMSDRQNFFDFISPVTEDFFHDKVVLDAGCGMGRFLKLGAGFGCQEIIGMDLSQSVEAAYRNTRHIPNAHVVQGDILSPPFKRCFDYIFSIGVLQFLSHPQQGFRELTRLLQGGGRISIWVYSREGNEAVIRYVTPIRKWTASRLSRPALYGFSYIVGTIQYLVLQAIYKPANEWKSLKRLSSLLPKNEYFYYNSQLSLHALVSVVFDHLVPQLVVYLSKEEVLEWFEKENMESIQISSRNNMSWRVHGVACI